MTHRQFRTFDRWLEKEWNKPNRNNYYLMKLIAVVEGLFSKKPTKLEPIKFETNEPKPPPTEDDKKARTRLALARWAPFIFGKKK